MHKKELKYYLSLLGVRSTSVFLDRYSYSLNRNSLFGIAKILSFYNVETECLKLKSPLDILKGDDWFPAVINYRDDFYILRRINQQYVECNKGRKTILFEKSEFFKLWDGSILLAEATEQSKEPHYIKNVIVVTTRYILSCIIVLFCLYELIRFLATLNTVYSGLSLLFNILGVVFSILLFLIHKQIKTELADMICTTFTKNGCDRVLNSNASNILGLISWSEIGLTFFFSNILLLINGLYEYASSLIALSCLYSFWSICYQCLTKKWCALCVLVQVVNVSLFLVNLYYIGLIFDWRYTTDTFIGYFFVGIAVCCLSEFISDKQELRNLKQLIRRVKESEDFYKGSTENHLTTDNDCPSNIILGCKDSTKNLVVVVNVFCMPCINLCKKIKELHTCFLKDIKVQIVFSMRNKSDNHINEILIDEYSKNGIEGFFYILEKWFEYGLYEETKFIEQHKKGDKKAEVLAHEKWIVRNNINRTPTLILNGKTLPNIYKIDDIPFLLE